MQLMQVPKEIHLSIIKSTLDSVDSVNVLKPLAFTCRHFAYLCLGEIWKTRINVKISHKKRKNKAYLLPLELLGDRINDLSITDYENCDKSYDEQQMEMSSLVTIRQHLLNNDTNIPSASKYHDALSETVKLGVVKVFNYIIQKFLNGFTSNAKDSLQSIRITFNQTSLTTDPSMIVMLVGKNCNNLRIFYIDIFQRAISKDSTMILLENCKKLEYLDITASSETDEALLMFGSMNSLVKFKIKFRLPKVTQKGWINLVRRPTGCPSWRVITIDDSRQIIPEFFETLEQDHHNLE
ncbi:10555_t:CDS:2 [Funneliformis geosporum]|nr:10555_t:CDS:2 [Funneliformis geosporum]